MPSHHAEDGHSVNNGLLNCQLVMTNKAENTYYIKDVRKRIVGLTETWLTGTKSGQMTIRYSTSPGYVFHYTPYTNSKEGGVVIIIRKP